MYAGWLRELPVPVAEKYIKTVVDVDNLGTDVYKMILHGQYDQVIQLIKEIKNANERR